MRSQLETEQRMNHRMQQNARQFDFETQKTITTLRIELAQLKRVFSSNYSIANLDNGIDHLKSDKTQFEVIDQLKERIGVLEQTIKQLK